MNEIRGVWIADETLFRAFNSQRSQKQFGAVRFTNLANDRILGSHRDAIFIYSIRKFISKHFFLTKCFQLFGIEQDSKTFDSF